MGASPGYHRAPTIASPALPAETETCSTAATLVIGVTYMAASSSISEGVNRKLKTLARQGYGYRDEAFSMVDRTRPSISVRTTTTRSRGQPEAPCHGLIIMNILGKAFIGQSVDG